MKLTDLLIDYAARPEPLRVVALRKFLRQFQVGSLITRIRAGAILRPHYAWCMYYAAVQAKALGHKAVTIAELGVAGGNGLACLCQHKKDIQKELGIEIVVVGFDSGAGLPQSTDPRDVRYAWQRGAFQMDQGALEARIAGQAQLVLGDVAKTVQAWNPEPGVPLGAVMFDLDYFTSTLSSFALLTKDNVLPRVWCYFDDITGTPEEALSDRVGEREAIRQFNDDPERGMRDDHLSPAYAFIGLRPWAWHQQIYIYHRLAHPDYSTYLGVESQKDLLKLVTG